MKNYRFAYMLLMLVTLLNCSKGKNEIMFMNNLTNNLSQIYKMEKIDIKIFDKEEVKISVSDSKFNNYCSEEKQKIAKQIGKLITELREDMPKIKTGELIFIDKSNYLIVKTSQSESFNIF